MKAQIKNIEGIVGKTIEKTLLDYSDLYLKFTDSTFTILRIIDDTEGYGYANNHVGVSDWEAKPTDSNLVELGIISKKENEDAIEKQELEYKKMEEFEEAEYKKRIEEQEKKQLEILNKKYNK